MFSRCLGRRGPKGEVWCLDSRVFSHSLGAFPMTLGSILLATVLFLISSFPLSFIRRQEIGVFTTVGCALTITCHNSRPLPQWTPAPEELMGTPVAHGPRMAARDCGFPLHYLAETRWDVRTLLTERFRDLFLATAFAERPGLLCSGQRGSGDCKCS